MLAVVVLLLLQLAGAGTLPEIDVVIPATRKDLVTLETTIARIRRFCANTIRRVVVISPEKLTSEEVAEWWPETKGFAFIVKDFERKANYQQQLKMYALDVVEPPLLHNTLILDSDVWWQRPVTFVDAEGRALYTASEQAYDVFKYRSWMRWVLPDLPRYSYLSCGVAHHMLFQRKVLRALLDRLRTAHNNADPWTLWKPNRLMSEYDLYFQFAFATFPQRVRLRPLRFLDSGELNATWSASFDYVAHHDDLRIWRNFLYWKEHWQRYSLTKTMPFAAVLALLVAWAVVRISAKTKRRADANKYERFPLKQMLRTLVGRVLLVLGLFVVILPTLFFMMGCRYNCPYPPPPKHNP